MTKQKENSRYRPDIDGLRAVACLAVVFYHAYPWTITGGFAGVDVFFVISGYLISLILYRNLFSSEKPGSINILDFYIRRVRRIFPALIMVLFTCLALGWFVLLPEEYGLLGKHSFGGAVYISNFILYEETGSYFDFSANSKLLLHLWSLGIEEQFYLIFPLFLYLIYKLRLGFPLSIFIFTVLSFAAGLYEIQTFNQSAAFYLPWCRFWELSSGALLAYLTCCPNRVKTICSGIIAARSEKFKKILMHILSVAGLAALIISFGIINKGYRFPGFTALLPVIGAGMIIFAGPQAVINKYVLGNKVSVFLGLISYPLYLWHWPLLSFEYIYGGKIPEDHEKYLAVFLALLLSIITYLYIEAPLRYGKHARKKAASLLAVLLLLGSFGLAAAYNNGFPSRFADEYNSHSSDEIRNQELIEHQLRDENNNCFRYYPQWRSQDNSCYMSENQDNVEVALIGDSYAGHLRFGMQDQFNKAGKGYNLFTVSCQIPAYGFRSAIDKSRYGAMRTEGSKLKDKALLDLLKDPKIRVVVLAHNPECSASEKLGEVFDDLEPQNNSLSYQEKWEKGYRRTLDMIKKSGKKALFILPNPYLPFEAYACNKRPFSNSQTCTFKRKDANHAEIYQKYEDTVKMLTEEYDNTGYMKLTGFFCDDEMCSIVHDNRIMYKDRGHLNFDGSLYVSDAIYKKIKEMME